MSQAAEYDAWAEYYDLTNTGLPGEAEFYVGHAVRGGGETLELGCGTGRIAIPMAMSGVHVTGLDNSKEMLRICRAKRRAVGKVPGKLTLVQADMRDFDLGRRFAFIAMAYRTFMHLLTPDEQRQCLRTVRRHLDDGGTFILNCWMPRPSLIATLAGPQGGYLRLVDRHTLPDDHFLLHFCATYCEEFRQRICEEHVLHETDPRGKILRSERLSLERAWTTAREMGNLVRLCGFDVDAVFGDFDCNPIRSDSDEMIWVLKGD